VSRDEYGSEDEMLGFAPGTIARIHMLEAVLAGAGPAERQQALASALWRTLASPASEEYDLERLVVAAGGRDIRAEVRMFPPKGTPPRGAR
jgi:hypothetical protein